MHRKLFSNPKKKTDPKNKAFGIAKPLWILRAKTNT